MTSYICVYVCVCVDVDVTIEDSIRQRKPHAFQIAIVCVCALLNVVAIHGRDCVCRWRFLRRFKKLERASRISFGN